jgi:hypothetical protein
MCLPLLCIEAKLTGSLFLFNCRERPLGLSFLKKRKKNGAVLKCSLVPFEGGLTLLSKILYHCLTPNVIQQLNCNTNIICVSTKSLKL